MHQNSHVENFNGDLENSFIPCSLAACKVSWQRFGWTLTWVTSASFYLLQSLVWPWHHFCRSVFDPWACERCSLAESEHGRMKTGLQWLGEVLLLLSQLRQCRICRSFHVDLFMKRNWINSGCKNTSFRIFSSNFERSFLKWHVLYEVLCIIKYSQYLTYFGRPAASRFYGSTSKFMINAAVRKLTS